MALDSIVVAATAGIHGFDCNTVLSADQAQQFRARGFRFAIRYLSRFSSQGPSDLSIREAADILAAGLGLMVVQHVAPAGWVPNLALGTNNGRNAALNASECGLLPGVNVWLDLEGVRQSAPAEDVIDYCNAWHDEVAAAGFVPGVYVGADAILTGDQLYWRLKMKHYWRSGSRVPEIPHRGYQMIQRIASGDEIAGVGIDRNVAMIDAFGDTVLWMAAAEPTGPVV
jgi:hypothetical protein